MSRKGFIDKKGDSVGKWNKRYFALNGTQLEFWVEEKDCQKVYLTQIWAHWIKLSDIRRESPPSTASMWKTSPSSFPRTTNTTAVTLDWLGLLTKNGFSRLPQAVIETVGKRPSTLRKAAPQPRLSYGWSQAFEL